MFLISDLSFISLLLVSGLTFSAGILHRWWCVLRESHLVLHDVHLPSLIMFILISCSRQCPNNQCSSYSHGLIHSTYICWVPRDTTVIRESKILLLWNREHRPNKYYKCDKCYKRENRKHFWWHTECFLS